MCYHNPYPLWLPIFLCLVTLSLSVGLEVRSNALDGPGPSNEYTGWPNIFDALGLMNLYTMAPLVLPRSLSTVVDHDVSKLSMINASGGGFLTSFIVAVPWENIFGAGIIPA